VHKDAGQLGRPPQTWSREQGWSPVAGRGFVKEYEVLVVGR